eukprot:m.340754 g.340754  ORF g.340754 m.340754 type:complete len:199 (+) comp19499_c0_seq1:99-695(+)
MSYRHLHTWLLVFSFTVVSNPGFVVARRRATNAEKLLYHQFSKFVNKIPLSQLGNISQAVFLKDDGSKIRVEQPRITLYDDASLLVVKGSSNVELADFFLLNGGKEDELVKEDQRNPNLERRTSNTVTNLQAQKWIKKSMKKIRGIKEVPHVSHVSLRDMKGKFAFGFDGPEVFEVAPLGTYVILGLQQADVKEQLAF